MRARPGRTLSVVAIVAATLTAGGGAAAMGPAAAPAAGTVLRDVPGARLAAARMKGIDVAALWTEPDEGFTTPYAATSDDGGTTFTAAYPVVGGGDARDVSVDICDGVAVVGFAVEESPGWTTVFGVRETGTYGGFNNHTAAVAPTRDGDVACRAGDLVVAWVAPTGPAARLHVRWWGDARFYLPGGAAVTAASARTSGPAGAGTWDLGPIGGPGRQAPSLAASARVVVAAWVDENHLRLARWRPAAAAPHALTRLRNRTLDTGTAAQPLRDPVVAADGDRVVVAWTRCGDLLARVSTDRGATFGPVRRLLDAPCPGEVGALIHDVTVAGRRIAVTYRHVRASTDQERLVRSTSDLATWTTVTIRPVGDRWAAGYVGAAPQPAAVRDTGSQITWLPPGEALP